MKTKHVFLIVFQTSIIAIILVGLLLLLIFFFKTDKKQQVIWGMEQNCMSIMELNENNNFFIDEFKELYLSDFKNYKKLFSSEKLKDLKEINKFLQNKIDTKKEAGYTSLNTSYGNYLIYYIIKKNKIVFMIKLEDQFYNGVYDIQRRGILIIIIALFTIAVLNTIFAIVYKKW